MRSHERWTVGLVAGLLAALGPAPAVGQTIDPFEVSVRQLSRAGAPQPDGTNHAMLLALRDLRDPELKPFFQSLVQSAHWPIQMDAILGLAELSGTGRVDPWLISELRTPTDRSDAIQVALDMGRIGPEEMERILAWEDLQPAARIVLLAERHRLGLDVDEDAVRTLTEYHDLSVRGLAVALLATMGDDTPIEPYAAAVEELEPQRRGILMDELASAAIAYRLPILLDMITPHLEASGTLVARETLVVAALAINNEKGLEVWERTRGEDPSRGIQVRWAVLLLGGAESLPPEAYDRIERSNELSSAIADAGAAVAGRGDPVAALIALYDLGHRRSNALVLQLASGLETPSARAVLLHIIDRYAETSDQSRGNAMQVVEAVRRLMEIDPQSALDRLAAAPDDGRLQEAILLGLCTAGAESAGEAAAQLPRVGSGLADALALLLIARYADELEQEDLHQLGVIAGGGGRVDQTLRAQAAWLYLRHSGNTKQALAKIVASS